MIRWVLSSLAVLIGLAVFLMACLSLVDANRLRAPIERYVTAHAQRPARIAGPLQIHLWSRHPGFMAQRVTLGNPPWVSVGALADIGTLSVTFDWPGLTRPFAIHRLMLRDATLHLYRDQAGLANWQWRDPRRGPGLARGTPLIHGLTATNLHLELTDHRRRLRFSGPVAIRDRRNGQKGLRMLGIGQLNGRPAVFDLDGDTLRTVSRKTPYRFAFAIRSSGSKLLGEGHLPRPIDLRYLVTTFRARGQDLKDLYFLTGLRFIDTGTFSASGKLTRVDRRFQYDDLHIESGQSELTGVLSLDASSPTSRIEANLRSTSLRLADLGARASGRAPTTAATSTLLSQSPISLFGVRGRDMTIHFEAQTLLVGRVPLQKVKLDMRAHREVLDVSLRPTEVLQGTLQGHLTFDVSKPTPSAKLRLLATGLHPETFQLKRSARKDTVPPPLSGTVAARVSLEGHGRSLHELGSSATGALDIALSRGAIRRSFTELAGVNLQGLGLMLSHDVSQTEARCGAANFKARDGIFEAQTLLLDTAPVLIEGRGTVDLGNEAIDLEFQGHPKHVRLRLRAPLTVQGSLRHPTVRMAPRKSFGQASTAVALGVLIAPLAAAMALVDPGLTKDANCAQLIGATSIEATEK